MAKNPLLETVTQDEKSNPLIEENAENPADQPSGQDYYIDPKSGRWVEGTPPKGVVGARSMTEFAHEQTPSSAFDTNRYDQNFRYVWVPRDQSNPSTVDAFAKGCTPFDNNGKASPHGHRMERVPGFGDEPCVVLGDLVCVRQPRGLHEAQEERRRRYAELRKSERDSENIANSIVDRSMEKLGITRGAKNSGYIDHVGNREIRSGYTEEIGQYTPRGGTYRSDENLTHQMDIADSVRAAKERVFGGFAGTPKYNRAVPDTKLNIAGRPNS